MDERAVAKAFAESSLAASVILRSFLEIPAVAKSAGVAADEMGKILVRRIAEITLDEVPAIVKFRAERRAVVAKWEADQAARRADGRIHPDDCPCEEECTKAKADAAYAKAVSDNRPHLDADRAMDPDVPATPWREEKPEPIEQPHGSANIDHGVSKAALDLGFERDGDEYVHRSLGHVMKMENDAFWITSGWDGSTTYKGTTPDDLVEAMELLDQ